jgi:magnesium-transporting ATPase (P-type)
MCSSCISEHATLCPSCRREIFRESGKFVDFRTLIVVFFGGLMGLGLYYFYMSHKPEFTGIQGLFPLGFIFFFLGISLIYTFYLYKDSDSFKSIGKEIPFIGYKLMFLWAILTAISLIPALLYLQKVILFITTKKKHSI